MPAACVRTPDCGRPGSPCGLEGLLDPECDPGEGAQCGHGLADLLLGGAWVDSAVKVVSEVFEVVDEVLDLLRDDRALWLLMRDDGQDVTAVGGDRVLRF